MKFICPEHGEFKPECVLYSCPLQARCHICSKLIEDADGGIKVLSDEESRRLRPELWKENS
jgi:ribosomal protein S27E